jgi:hypothetical protein
LSVNSEHRVSPFSCIASILQSVHAAEKEQVGYLLVLPNGTLPEAAQPPFAGRKGWFGQA